MPTFLSTQWMALAADAVATDEALAAAISAADPGEGVTVVYVVRSVPESIADDNGQVTYSIHLSSRYGAVFSAPASTTPTAKENHVILTLDYETAAAINRGDLNPGVALALARVSVRGAAGLLVPLQDAFARIPDALAALRSDTTYETPTP